jgi:hypothetical protein
MPLGRPNSLGFDPDKCRAFSVIQKLSSLSIGSGKIFIFFIFFIALLRVKNTYKNPYSLKAVII